MYFWGGFKREHILFNNNKPGEIRDLVFKKKMLKEENVLNRMKYNKGEYL